MHDVIVLGTGAAGLVAALAAHEAGATVGLYEKADVVGGTTALSGGIVWVPNNPHMAAAGLADSRDEAQRRPLLQPRHHLRSGVDAQRVRARQSGVGCCGRHARRARRGQT